MFFRLPPAGNQVNIKFEKSPFNYLEKIFNPFQLYFYGSGAEALAAAITAIISLRSLNKPEVILPAYACPELISAIHYANARPVLVDLEPESPQMDLNEIENKITNNTVAIIAINLFGIQERITAIRSIIDNNKIVIIEDSAQYFPGNENNYEWKGDIIILSFGRGKPISLLDGGAAFTKNKKIQQKLKYQSIIAPMKKVGSRLQLLIKLKVYNLLLSPYLYWLPNSLPFLRLGETTFSPLHEISSINQDIVRLLPTNIAKYQSSSLMVQKQIHETLKNIDNPYLIDLPAKFYGADMPGLIRYPILIKDTVLRDCLYNRLYKKGLGVTKMYKTILPSVDGLEGLLTDQGKFPNATRFACTLLTLPTHQNVKSRHIKIMGEILSDL